MPPSQFPGAAPLCALAGNQKQEERKNKLILISAFLKSLDPIHRFVAQAAAAGPPPGHGTNRAHFTPRKNSDCHKAPESARVLIGPKHKV